VNFPNCTFLGCRNFIGVTFALAVLGVARVSYAEGEPAEAVSTETVEAVSSETVEAVSSETAESPPATEAEANDSDAPWHFGSTRIRIGLIKPTFSDDLKFYERLYDKPSTYPTFGFDYSFLRKYVAVGFGVKLGYYTDHGHAAQSAVDNPTANDVTVDDHGPTELTLLPLATVGTIQFTPFPKKYLVIDGYAGLEHLYFQEVRVNTGDGSSPEGENAKSPITIKGSRQSLVLGVAANIRLDPLDEQSVNSMRGALGIGSVYLSPFVEVIKAMGGKSGVKFDRTNIGLGFTFESIN
jgi:hypothetical protein